MSRSARSNRKMPLAITFAACALSAAFALSPYARATPPAPGAQASPPPAPSPPAPAPVGATPSTPTATPGAAATSSTQAQAPSPATPATSVPAGTPPVTAAEGAAESAPAPDPNTATVVFATMPPATAMVTWGRKKLGKITPGKPLVVVRPRDSGPLDVVVRAEGFLAVQTRAHTFSDNRVLVKLTPLENISELLGYRAPVEPPPLTPEQAAARNALAPVDAQPASTFQVVPSQPSPMMPMPAPMAPAQPAPMAPAPPAPLAPTTP